MIPMYLDVDYIYKLRTFYQDLHDFFFYYSLYFITFIVVAIFYKLHKVK